MQLMARAFSRALDNAGSSMAAKIAMMAITTNNSMSVKKFRMMIFLKMVLVELVGVAIGLNLRQMRRYVLTMVWIVRRAPARFADELNQLEKWLVS